MLLVIGRFFIPFAILLLQGIKKKPHQLCIVAGWIMFMQALDMYIIVLPFTPRHRRASQHLGFPLPDRDRLQPRFPLSAVDWKDFHLPGARPTAGRVTAFEELTWPT